ncbi:hypothetical protein R5R35_000749 [Gryllus longicercus]|uniref:CKK domain-containing protein n=1 Tax=Gryllus longicercus TaxID=2509291 RepID=A0AAN9W996_9ORTH
MWSAISRLFSKTNSNSRNSEPASDTKIMDRGEDRRRTTADWEPQDTYDTRQAKQRASVKWLLSKAYNNRVPDNLREPFYRDHEDQEHLKPQVVHALASAELYCLALANIYSDPNYHNLNHWGVLQALGRKGVFAAEPPDARLTETVLIQTTPLRLSAHMAVIEALMALYAKEVVTPDRVLVAVQRFGPQHGAGAAEEPEAALPADHEAGLLLWVNRAGQALRRRARQEMDATAASPAPADGKNAESDRSASTPTALPDLPIVREWKDLSNGISLAALVSFYCSEELPWSQVVVGRVPSISDSMHNLMLVYNFCNRCLPASVFHMMPEDVTYMQGSMKQNLIVFLADLFNVLEIHPVKCVRFQGTDRALWKEVLPRNSQGVAHKRSFPQSISAIPDLRSNLAPGAQPASASGAFTVSKSAPTIQTSMPLKKSHSLQPADIHGKGGDSSSQDDRRGGGEEAFVVHRGRAVPTLASVAQSSALDEPLIPARLRPAKEKQNQDSKAEERGEPVAAGRPSNWEEQRRSSYAGRRSRRNSVSDDSQLTLENFGGSQENLHLLTRNPDKEPAVHVGRKTSVPESPSPATAVRSSLQDARSCGVEMLFSGSADNGYYSGEKRDEEKPTTTTAAHYPPREPAEPTPTATSFAELSRVKADANKSINISYMQQERESDGTGANNGGAPPKSSFLNKKVNGTGGSTNGNAEKKTTFAALPNNTTTWQQQSSNSQMMHQAESQQDSDDGSSHVMASQLHNIRMKLEEKRRRIESEKRRMEVVMNKQRQKVGKAAFLQAVTKGKGSLAKGAEPESQNKDSSAAVEPSASRPQRPLSLQEISEDASSVEHKWLDSTLPYIEERRTPDIENMDLEQYQQSLAQMNSSLHEIQADIQRLASQQHQIQGLHSQPIPQAPVGYTQPSPPPPPPPVQQTFQPQPQPQFYLHEQQAHRRTWAQPEVPAGPFAAQDGRTLWGSDRHQKQQPASYNCQPASGFMLHDPHGSAYPMQHAGNGDVRYHNGEQSHAYHHHHHHLPPTGMPQTPPQHHSLGVNHVAYPVTSTSPSGSGGYQSFQLHHGAGDASPSPYSGTPPSASPVHRTATVQQRISQMLGQESTDIKVDEKNRTSSGVMHAPIPTPPVDDMEPQSISFIGTPSTEEGLAQSIKGLQITSGSRTYRIPSPTRPGISRSAFHHQQQQQQQQQLQQHLPELPDGRVASPTENHQDGGESVGGTEKGFYISFDNDAQPKRPKPPLRVKRSSPKKERPVAQHESMFLSEREEPLGSEPVAPGTFQEEPCARTDIPTPSSMGSTPGTSDSKAQAAASGVGLVIGTELLNPDPTVLDEMERKKERIMLLSLQRRQQQEELKACKEQEAQRRRDLQKLRQEERERKKEEERLRRAAILEQYKLKKAIEEAEREGKLLPEKPEMTVAKPVPKLRNKSSTMRPRPKTIHVDSGSVQELQEGGLSPSRSKKGSTSNLTDSVYSAPMKRDYYRGSQDSLADRLDERRGLGASLFKDSPDDGRGASPCRSVNQLGRRGSYKTSRGSSTDQDSMVYRYADTDSGLGRATPPRRAPSPGMSSMRHLPSPSGPGSLPPGLMTKRRMFDDGSSDISSTPSSMMEYTGPRLYKQPATKSNRGIMLNAVEYCVFPGAVNKEAKRRVLEEIARSESKHFLILFRDAGCQFRALYAYCPEREDVAKLYGTGPKQITDRMFDKFFKYNSGGKCFSQVHTKHLTVTIDAFTIHNSLWQGKKVALPNKKDMPLVI